jgi:hypothetical protein
MSAPGPRTRSIADPGGGDGDALAALRPRLRHECVGLEATGTQPL